MKAPLITLSILANVLLAAGLLSPSAATALRLPGPRVAAKATAGAGPTYGARFAAANGGTSAAGATSAWASLPDDPKDFVAQLRAAGLSDSIIATMLSSKLAEQVTARRRELLAAFPPVPYWSSAYAPSYYNDPKAVAELRQMTEANTKLVKDLLGDALPKDAYTRAQERLQFGDLAPEKIDTLKQIVADYGEMSSGVRGSTLGITLQEDRDKLMFLEQSKDQDIRAALSPQEYQDYLLRSSTTASSLRNNLVLFEPTEAEFRALFAVQLPFDQKFNLNAGLISSVLNERDAAQKQLTADLKAVLDPARAADYEKATDYSYRTATQLVSRLNLPKETATTVWQTQKEIQQRVTAVQSDGTLEPDARNKQLVALQNEATTRMSNALGGARGLDMYKSSSGSWIQYIVPQPAPAR